MPGLNTQFAIRYTFQKVFITVLLTGILLLIYSATTAQSLPVGTPVFEDYYRRMQLLGQIDSNISFTVRPLTSQALGRQDIFKTDTTDTTRTSFAIRSFAKDKRKFQLLPIMLQSQYNSKRPYGWNDGPMIPARRFQSVASAGIYAKYGLLSIQLRPEFVYAQNTKLDPSYSNSPGIPKEYIDLPDRFGDKSYSRIFAGQSSIRLTYKALSLGLSTENLWWGPGIRNSLLMSNNAPGFTHVTLNTTRPISTAIGSFEGQIIGGRLVGSGFLPKPEDWRYLSGMTMSYQPKWVPGLFIGFIRSLQLYGKDMNRITDYIPGLTALAFKSNLRGPDKPEDQLGSVFSRWLWTQAQAEVYFEYGRGDYSIGFRDYLLEPEHSRGYLFGFQKLLFVTSRKDTYLQLNVEVTHLQQSVNYSIRTAGSWYNHAAGIVHGYTHKGEVLGAGIGPGSNLQSIHLNYRKRFNNVGIQIERLAHVSDYYPAYNTGKDNFIDLIIGLTFEKKFRRLAIDGAFRGISSTQPSDELHQFNMPRHNFDFSARLGFNYRL